MTDTTTNPPEPDEPEDEPTHGDSTPDDEPAGEPYTGPGEPESEADSEGGETE